jgi:hypothetical protein
VREAATRAMEALASLDMDAAGGLVWDVAMASRAMGVPTVRERERERERTERERTERDGRDL